MRRLDPNAAGAASGRRGPALPRRRGARTWRAWLLLLPGLLGCGGCLTFSSFQTARIPEADKPEMTVALSRCDLRDDSRSGWSMLEFRHRARLEGSDRAESHLKFTILHADGGSAGGVLGGGVKFALWRNHLALGLPVSWYIGDATFQALQFHPGLVATLPAAPGFDLNADCEAYLLASGGMRPLIARHIGLAMGTPDRRLVLRPEVGWLSWDDYGRRRTAVQFGLAVEFREPRRTRRPGSGAGSDWEFQVPPRAPEGGTRP
jgi:hypothetical protein